MDASQIARLRASPAFLELERKRSTLGWGLAIFIIAIYGAFLVLVAFDHDLVAQPIGAGPLTLAFPLGLGVILASVVLTGIYVARANSLFDRLTAEVVAEAGQ
jgi:uncharacterized membrane protein (DUF485 family)